MQEFINFSPIMEELLQNHMKEQGISYSKDIRDLYLKLHSVHILKQEENFKSDLQENIKK